MTDIKSFRQGSGMIHKKNKRFSLQAALILLLAALLLPLSAGCAKKGSDFTLPTRQILDTSAEELKFGGYGYRLYDDGNIIITSYSGSETNITIPQTIDGKKVIAIGNEAFLLNKNIQSVKLGRNIETIGDYAFFGCESLHSIEFGPNLWSIGADAFYETPWYYSQTDEFVIVGDGVLLKYNGTSASVTVPDNVKHISSAFAQYYDLISVDVGDNVLTVGTLAFAYCPNLKYVRLGSSVRLIGDFAFCGSEKLAAIDIPDKVEKIGENAFDSCYYLYDVKIGSSVREIGYQAFYRCYRIRSITLPKSLINIGSSAFAECASLSVIFYTGTEEQFAALVLSESNYLVKDVPKIYNYIPRK